ncbi:MULTISPECIES: toll/interleukin-1 receptor domain-containing protein [unclassified Saccharothrix]|uniref:toll/interleukin-1 receptor domain-containing protein n=1 Tax=unclassified Saccharothrix TaxID=2593673 RepID=UPI00307EF292
MHHVFISYSRRDEDWVLGLRAVLVERGVRTWLDKRDIPVSAPWLDEVTEAIKDAALFLVCHSPYWTASQPCAAEAAVASEVGIQQVVVAVGGRRRDAADNVITALRTVPPVSYPLRELDAQARGWQAAGRPARLLASKQQQVRSARFADAASPLGRAFLAASARRHTRRKTAVFTGVLITVVAVLFGMLLVAARSALDWNNEQQVGVYRRVVEAKVEIARDPYRGLRTASRLGDNESGIQADLLQGVLSTPVPDDAFDVPAAATGFATTPIGSDVLVKDVNQRTWSRAASAGEKRTADPGPEGTGRAPSPYTASFDGHVVTVWSRGQIHRKVHVPDARSVFAVSPDARWLAISSGSAVSVVDVEAGAVRRKMIGAPTEIGDLAWSADGNRIWATAGPKVVSWRWTTGTVLVNEPTRWFQAILPADSAHQAWLVERQGSLRLVSLQNGQTAREIRVDDTVIAVGGNGTTVIIRGLTANWLVRLADGATRRFELPSTCSRRAGNLTLDTEVAVLPCDDSVVVVSLANGQVTRTVRVGGQGPGAATITKSGNVVIGGIDGEVFWNDRGSDGTRTLMTNLCGVDIAAVLVPPAEDQIVPIGTGAAQIGCARVARVVDGDWQWNTNLGAAPSHGTRPSLSLAALAGTFSPSGKAIAIGYADGSLVMQPTENLGPTVTVWDIAGGVRSVLLIDSTLYVASRHGILQAIPWCDTCLTNAALAQQAATMANRAAALGLGD